MASNGNQTTKKLIGVISDTHGLLRPEAIAALQGVDLILHAGDIGKPQVLEGLKTIAPVIAVRGNNDQGDWAEPFPEHKTVKVGSITIYLLHIVQELNFIPQTEGIRVIISGHSHKPSIVDKEGILFLNPGSAGPRRFKLPISVAHLQVDGSNIGAKIIDLAV